jgi:isoleucyl-tRNA synthetase
MPESFQPLPPTPDNVALELEVLSWWASEGIFEALRERNRGGPKWSFIDGPITANNPMGVHHAWGRALKDVFQRYKALRGFEQRYQNGFDCQGLWVEVEVEKSLGLNSKRDIEEYGLDRFADACRARVAEFSEVIADQSKRLGMWMDWERSYFTFSDTNIEYIWRFLKEVHRRGWLYKGHRSTQWCPRCGTSLSQHEQAGEDNYRDLMHPSLYVRFPLLDRDGESLVIWTTTPWTLPANVAAAVKRDARYGKRASGDWVAVDIDPDEAFEETKLGSELVGWRYRGPFDELPAQAEVEHRVIPWDEVALDEGTGIVHIAPGAGAEDFELSREFELPVLTPVNESGQFYREYGELEGMSTDGARDVIIDELRDRGLLVEAGEIEHRYPICWRCSTPLIFRVVDDWFIACDEIRQPLIDANQSVEWTPSFYSKRMDDWLRNMGDWNISRKRYFGLPLPFYPCESCGELNVIGSKAELEERATAGIEQLRELHRPWIDHVSIRCEHCGNEALRRIPEVGDAWLDAGIVPLSTLGWQSPEVVSEGYGTGSAKGLTKADLPDHAYWETWFPADWISEMREQIRLWFYSISFMSMTLVGELPYRSVLTYEKVHDETGRPMHKSWGNAIEANEAMNRMGADVMRWLYAGTVPSQNVNFGFGPAQEIKRRLLTLWNSAGFLVTYANIAGWRPEWGAEPSSSHALDRWLVARTRKLVVETEAAYEVFWTPSVVEAFESFVDDLSNWYIRRSRRRFWDGEPDALATLWWALVRALQTVAPVMPFLSEHLWRNLVPGGPASVFLAGWPETRGTDEALLAEIAEVRSIVELGRRARDAENIRLRQPLRTLFVAGASHADAHVEELRDELRVKEVEFLDAAPVHVTYKPNLRTLGPRLGKDLPTVRDALARGDLEELPEGGVRAAGLELAADDLLVERAEAPGWTHDGALSVGIDLELDDELLLEGRVFDLIHRVNSMRKDAGLELTDRIVLTLPRDLEDLLRFEQRIKDEVLAVEIRLDGGSAPQIAKA